MEDNLVKNKRIAKNTIMLYFRMALTLIVSLYTSRVVLNTLGVEDYGIYNIVGGLIVMFSFLNTSMTNACQKFFSAAVAKNDTITTQKIFSTTLFAHVILATVFLVITETIGLWFLYNKMDIPCERFQCSTIVYQIIIVNTLFGIFKVPYNASIIANEKMNFYAYTSIVESILKLLIVYLLLVIPVDKLLLYSLLNLSIGLIMLFWYMLYCNQKFDGNKFSFHYDSTALKEILSFSGWNVFGSFADLGYKQGSNIILNLFYGVNLNAAMGVANQARSAVFSFVSNLQVAANPQIIKSYTIEDYSYFKSLVCRISKYSYYLMLIVAIPLILNTDYILKLWLITPPAYTNIIFKLCIVFSLIDTLHGPLWTSMQATGKIAIYQIVISAILLLNLPLCYMSLKCGGSPEMVIVVQIIVSIVTLIVRMWFSKTQIDIPVSYYLSNVILPVVIVSILVIPSVYVLSFYYEETILFLCGSSVACFFITLLAIYFAGITKQEKKLFTKYVRNSLNKLNSHKNL